MDEFLKTELIEIKMKADSGDLKAMVDLANIYSSEERCDEYSIKIEHTASINLALSLYKSAAEKGYTEAQYNLGCCYYFLENFEHNEEQAIKWFLLAANKGHSKSEKYLGDLYADKEDYLTALAFYERAAEKDNAEAYYELGSLYEYGNGVEKNDIKANEYYDKSKEIEQKEEADFDKNANRTPDEICEAINLEDASNGSAKAMANLAIIYYGQNKYDSAYDWAQKAVDSGNEPKAHYVLGKMYENGYFLPFDMKLALEQYGFAAELGHTPSQKNLEWFKPEIVQHYINKYNQDQLAQKTDSPQIPKPDKQELIRQKQQMKQKRLLEKQRLKEAKHDEKERRKYNKKI